MADTVRALELAGGTSRAGGERTGSAGRDEWRGSREFPERLGRVDLPGDAGRLLLYAVVLDDDGTPLRAYGVVLERSAYAAATTRSILSSVALLPPSLTRGAVDDALSVTVTGEGARLFHSGGEAAAATEVVDTLATPLGSYLLHVAVRPDMADRLVIGGLPRSRLPLLLGIFLLTLGLSAVAMVQLRRQQALVRLRSGFVASVSHELRTPLAQIRLFSDLLASGRLREEQRARSVRIIGEEAQRLAYLVENVLRFSRSEQRQDRVPTERTDLAALTREIVDAFAPLAHSRHARIDAALEPGAVAEVDRDAVRQVLLNLLDNAVKYGPAGQTVRVGVAREGARIRLRVDDEGPGIPPADRGAVWEPYHRLRRETEGATGGSGIGLAVVRDLVALHGGSVGVDVAPGGGARFLVWFPAAPHPLPVAARPAEGRVPA
jgi:signal transduction histidine kinase